MDEFHHIPSLTAGPGTDGGFGDAAAVKINEDCVVAGPATEEGGFHVWDDGRCADNKAFDTD